VEYDLFPYSEATHRQLRFLYSVGIQYNNYLDSTIYNKVKENLFRQEFNIAFQVQKKWGSVNLALLASNYLNDFSKNRVELESSMRLRIFKGLSLELSGSIAHINDQLNLKKGDISEADRLLELRELSTQYRIEGGIGLTYTFGSIYNNVVNPRFGFGGGGGPR
jgi:outer membrane usher protein FimD/PapC